MITIMRALTVLFSFVLSTDIAVSGDFATRHIHGFSADGKLFAFEEYGVQDGSGFPYSTIYIIDTDTDNWTAGSPFKAQLNDETKTVFDAKTGELLGAHMVGAEVTEMIQGYTVGKTLETTEAELMQTVFPHPTISESMHESVLAAYGKALHI